jgi:hypothetical protein
LKQPFICPECENLYENYLHFYYAQPCLEPEDLEKVCFYTSHTYDILKKIRTESYCECNHQKGGSYEQNEKVASR